MRDMRETRQRGRLRLAAAAALVTAILSAACSKPSAGQEAITTNRDEPAKAGEGRAATGDNAMHTLEQVKSWAGPDASVMPIEDIQIPGMHFFWIDETSPSGPERGKGIVVRDSAERWLEGDEAMRAVLSHAGENAALLARFSLLLLEDGGTPIVDLGDTKALPESATGEAREVGVMPPRLNGAREGRTLEYWSYFRRLSRPGLMRSRLALATLDVTRSSVTELRAESAEPIAEATAWLDSPDGNTRRKGIELLASSCSDAAAAQTLASAITGHSQVETRALAAQMSRRCERAHEATAGVVSALMQALETDASAEVRQWAASSLGDIGAGNAKAALRKAQTSDVDEGVRLMAQMALKKLR